MDKLVYIDNIYVRKKNIYFFRKILPWLDKNILYKKKEFNKPKEKFIPFNYNDKYIFIIFMGYWLVIVLIIIDITVIVRIQKIDDSNRSLK